MSTKCAATNCGKKLAKAWQFMCSQHWASLPKLLQDRVWREYKASPGSREHFGAMKDCIEHIAKAEAEASNG